MAKNDRRDSAKQPEAHELGDSANQCSDREAVRSGSRVTGTALPGWLVPSLVAGWLPISAWLLIAALLGVPARLLIAALLPVAALLAVPALLTIAAGLAVPALLTVPAGLAADRRLIEVAWLVRRLIWRTHSPPLTGIARDTSPGAY